MHLVTRVHSDHVTKMAVTVRPAIVVNPVLHANFMARCFIERELLPIEVLQCGNRNFLPFDSCDLDLEPMTFIRTRHIVRGNIPHVQIRTFYVMTFESYRLTDIHTHRHTDTTKIIYHAASRVINE